MSPFYSSKYTKLYGKCTLNFIKLDKIDLQLIYFYPYITCL